MYTIKDYKFDSFKTVADMHKSNYARLVEDDALEIKNIVEKNKASFAFPSTSIYVEKK